MNKLLLAFGLILVVSLTPGCNSVRSAFMGDPTVKSKDKLEYMKAYEKLQADHNKLKQTQKQFIIFQYIAAAFLIFGGAMIFIMKTSTSLGVGFILIGFLSSGWGLTATSSPKLIIILMVIGVLLGGLYVVQGMYSQRKDKAE